MHHDMLILIIENRLFHSQDFVGVASIPMIQDALVMPFAAKRRRIFGRSSETPAVIFWPRQLVYVCCLAETNALIVWDLFGNPGICRDQRCEQGGVEGKDMFELDAEG